MNMERKPERTFCLVCPAKISISYDSLQILRVTNFKNKICYLKKLLFIGSGIVQIIPILEWSIASFIRV